MAVTIDGQGAEASSIDRTFAGPAPKLRGTTVSGSVSNNGPYFGRDHCSPVAVQSYQQRVNSQASGQEVVP